MDEDFANAPMSINELRSDKSQSCTDWTPRDALINVLRHLDKDKPDVDTLVICWREKDENGRRGKFRIASPDIQIALGLLTYTIHKTIE